MPNNDARLDVATTRPKRSPPSARLIMCRSATWKEHARYGVIANAILPGWIETDMTAGARANEKFVGAMMPRIPMRRFGNPAGASSI